MPPSLMRVSGLPSHRRKRSSVSTAQDLPLRDTATLLYGEPVPVPTLRLVQAAPLDFDEVVRRVRPRLHRYAVRRLGDVHEAEELVQEALLRAYTHREQLRTEDDLAAWTTVVTGRLVIDRLRVRGRSTSVADVPEGSRVGRDTADVVVARDEARTALDALDAMPARQAAVLWAREVEGRSYDELCRRFEMTEPAVRSVLTRARKALRREYALRGGTLPAGGLAVLAPWVAGLSLAAKLRRMVTRITAPTVLGAVGVTALGGLALSPFGSRPDGLPNSFHPAQAVVTSAHPVAVEAVPHSPSFVVRTSARTAAVASVRDAVPAGQPGSPAWTAVRPLNHFNCASNGPTIDTGARNVTSRLFGMSCQSRHGNEIVVGLNPAGLPNPTNINAVTIQYDYAACPHSPTNPVVSCTSPHPSQQGANK